MIDAVDRTLQAMEEDADTIQRNITQSDSVLAWAKVSRENIMKLADSLANMDVCADSALAQIARAVHERVKVFLP